MPLRFRDDAWHPIPCVMGLIVRSSQIHAVGCYTSAPISMGTFIVEYTGPRLQPEECEHLYKNDEITYLFGMEGDAEIIDGHGTAAFLNHSCDPNCETEQIDGHVWIVAQRDIAPEEELTYDYNLYDGDALEDAPCTCGSPKCRGYMYEPEEIARLKRLARKAGKKQKNKKPHRSAA